MKRTIHLLGRAAASTPKAAVPSRARAGAASGSITPSRPMDTTSSNPASTSSGPGGASPQPPPSHPATSASEAPAPAQAPAPGAVPLALPAAPSTTAPSGAGQGGAGANEVRTLDVSGGSGSLALDHLGPMVIHKDGTVSRIANWAEMTTVERENTVRVLGRRNQLRLSSLRKEGGEASG